MRLDPEMDRHRYERKISFAGVLDENGDSKDSLHSSSHTLKSDTGCEEKKGLSGFQLFPYVDLYDTGPLCPNIFKIVLRSRKLWSHTAEPPLAGCGKSKRKDFWRLSPKHIYLEESPLHFHGTYFHKSMPRGLVLYATRSCLMTLKKNPAKCVFLRYSS